MSRAAVGYFVGPQSRTKAKLKHKGKVLHFSTKGNQIANETNDHNPDLKQRNHLTDLLSRVAPSASTPEKAEVRVPSTVTRRPLGANGPPAAEAPAPLVPSVCWPCWLPSYSVRQKGRVRRGKDTLRA